MDTTLRANDTSSAGRMAGEEPDDDGRCQNNWEGARPTAF